MGSCYVHEVTARRVWASLARLGCFLCCHNVHAATRAARPRETRRAQVARDGGHSAAEYRELANDDEPILREIAPHADQEASCRRSVAPLGQEHGATVVGAAKNRRRRSSRGRENRCRCSRFFFLFVASAS